MGHTKLRIAPVALILLVLVFSTGCQSMPEASPETHMANATSVYIAAVRGMTTLASAGLVDLEVAEQFEEVRLRAAAMLVAAEAALAGGVEFNFTDMTSTLTALQSVLAIAVVGTQGGG